MPDKNNAVDEFLGTLNGNATVENQDVNPFADLEIKQPEGGQPKDDQEPKGEEEKVPFHKDPKVQKFIQKEIEKATKNLTPAQVEQVKTDKGADDLITAFTAIIGNDTPEKVQALNALEREINQLRVEARSATEQIQAEKQAEYEATVALTEGLDAIEEEFDTDLTSNDPIARKTKTEFLEFVERIAPKDSEGNIREFPDFQEAFRIFQEVKAKPSQPSRAKELAARSMARAGDPSTIPTTERIDWKAVDNYFSKL